MRLLVSLLFSGSLAMSGQTVVVAGDSLASWAKVFGSVGMTATAAPSGSSLQKLATAGALVVVEGETLGVKASAKRIVVRSVVDEHQPKLPVIWEAGLEVPVFTLPAAAHVYARERWSGAPLCAGWREGKGAVLWHAVGPGAKGYERFPYALQAAADLGMRPPFRSNRLWAFFDSSYRLRVDLEYFADKWQAAGIGALQVAAWHYNESDPERDAFLRRLIEACHRRSILVYAWLELPHVSEKFWADHPEWREKTAIGQDAHLDWRKLMNLANRDCFRAVSASTRGLLERFDWDGANLAELYFESLEGMANPSRFTPMNEDVRREYRALMGLDPQTLFSGEPKKDDVASFLQYRAELARRMQSEWLGELEAVRVARPGLDLVLTHVDDRFDPRMRDLIGADASRVLPLLDRHDFTFLIEDPATVWHLGPERYPQIAAQYAPLTDRRDKLAIDINIVERYQDVYPTKQQTGTELYQLVHLASAAFPRVALYFESSILKADYPLLAASGAAVTKFERLGDKTVIESPYGVGYAWTGEALLDGRPWPVTGNGTAWLPAGAHVLEASNSPLPAHLVGFNGDLRTARSLTKGLEFSYKSSARALATLDREAKSVEVDGARVSGLGGTSLVLPRGQHVVTVLVD